MKDNKIYLQNLLDAIYRIDIWTQDSVFEEFADDEGLLQSSIIRQLEVIGETANQLGKDFTDKYPEVPWAKIVGMRNRLIPEYQTIDLDLTWEVVKHGLMEDFVGNLMRIVIYGFKKPIPVNELCSPFFG